MSHSHRIELHWFHIDPTSRPVHSSPKAFSEIWKPSIRCRKICLVMLYTSARRKNTDVKSLWTTTTIAENLKRKKKRGASSCLSKNVSIKLYQCIPMCKYAHICMYMWQVKWSQTIRKFYDSASKLRLLVFMLITSISHMRLNFPLCVVILFHDEKGIQRVSSVPVA